MKSHKPTIAIFITSLSNGGAERVVSQILQQLENIYTLHLILMEDEIDYILSKSVIKHVLSINSDSIVAKFISIKSAVLQLTKYVNDNKVKVLLSFMYRPNIIAGLAKTKMKNTHLVSNERSFPSKTFNINSPLGKIRKGVLKYTYNKADILLTNSKLSAEDLVNNFQIESNISTIYNPIDIQSIVELNLKVPDLKKEAPFYYILIGSFKKAKNHELAINAFATMHNKDSQLIFMGRGERKERMKQLVQKLNIEDKVTFLDFQNNPYSYLQSNNSCLILSSIYEGFPNVILEALACKVPVISTDICSGPREILAPDTNFRLQNTDSIEYAKYGILTPNNNVVLLAEAMDTIRNDKSLRSKYAAHAYERIKTLDISNVSAKYKEVINKLLI